MLGDIVKVTPSSKVVGDLALFMVTSDLTENDLLDPSRKLSFPLSVVELMQGKIGVPEGGWPKKLQKIVLDSAGVKPIKGRAGTKLAAANFDAIRKDLQKKIGRSPSDRDVLSYLLYPQVFLDFQQHVAEYEGTQNMPTPAFFYGLSVGDEIA